MDAQTKAEDILAEMRDNSTLAHLRRRARCPDGSLDMRLRANKGLRKDSKVSDYYDPTRPDVDVDQEVIELYLVDQQQRYDSARYQELTARVKALELERSSLLRFKEKAKKHITQQREEIRRFMARLHRQPQEEA
jgi:hypothetical protein